MKKKAYLFLLFILLISCIDSKLEDRRITIHKELKRFIILNEGNFTYGNASVNIIYPDSSTLNEEKLFQTVNGRPLGDVAQSMIKLDEKYFIVINNSRKIEVTTLDFKEFKTITGLTSPRYILPVSDEIAYVSDLYAKAISILNYKNYTIVGKIETGKPTERMIKFKDKVFVTNYSYGHSTIQVIDCKNHKLIKEIEVGPDPTDMAMDKYNHLWVLSTGGYSGASYATDAKISVLNPDDYSVIKDFTFPNSHPSHMKIGVQLDTIYYLQSTFSVLDVNSTYGIYKMSIEENNTPVEPYIKQNRGNLFYNFFVTDTNEIVVSDAIDFQQKGVMFQYHKNTKIDSFRVGIIPQFIFKEEAE